MAGHLNKCNQCGNKYKYFLLDADVHIWEISRIDAKDWDLLKLATALMLICCPEKIIEAPRLVSQNILSIQLSIYLPFELVPRCFIQVFPAKQLKIFKKHAPLYKNKILKIPLIVAYDKMYWARKVRYMVARQLHRLIKHDKKGT